MSTHNDLSLDTHITSWTAMQVIMTTEEKIPLPMMRVKTMILTTALTLTLALTMMASMKKIQKTASRRMSTKGLLGQEHGVATGN